ncbi:MAG: tetratricopeptide repeat protein, partial [Planctomycetaceae bacterium]|nr:tetratricopeptide repeat protein [Planctomycetaceae bacterium]
VVFFELLTGRLPFPVMTGVLGDIIDRGVHDRQTVPSVRKWNPAVSPATEAIVRKCLRPDPGDRYQTAEDLVEDLRRQREARPLRFAGNPSIGERTRKWFQRHPGATSGGSISLICAVCLMLTLLAWNIREQRLASLEAFQTYTGARQAIPETLAALSVPLSDPDERAAALSGGQRLLETYGVLDSASWMTEQRFQKLSNDEQENLRHAFGEMLFLMASAESQFPPAENSSTSDRPADPGEDNRTTSEEPSTGTGIAFQYNQRAIDCFADVEIPQILVQQHQELAAAAGVNPREFTHGDLVGGESTVDQSSEAARLLVQNRLSAAASLLEDLAVQAPDDFLVWFRLGICHYGLGRFEDAAQCFTTCLAISPTSGQAHYRRGMARLKDGQPAAAREDFDEYLTQHPDSGPGLVSRGLTWYAERQWQRAADDFTAAINCGFSQTRIYFLRSQCFDELGEAGLAATDRQAGLEKTPTDALSYMARGVARLNEEPEAAIADFRAAVMMNPHQYDAYLNIAHVLSEKLNRPDDAIEVLNESLQEGNEHAMSWIGRAILHARQQHTEQAHADADKALELSDTPMVLYQVACVHALAPADDDATETAMRLFARAVAEDDTLIRKAMSDPDLKSLHRNDRFRQLIAAARILQLMTTTEDSRE